jgi:hypothetical protein
MGEFDCCGIAIEIILPYFKNLPQVESEHTPGQSSQPAGGLLTTFECSLQHQSSFVATWPLHNAGRLHPS